MSLVTPVYVTGSASPQAVCSLLYKNSDFSQSVVAFKHGKESKNDYVFMFKDGRWVKTNSDEVLAFVQKHSDLRKCLFIASEENPADEVDYEIGDKWQLVYQHLSKEYEGNKFEDRVKHALRMVALQDVLGDVLEGDVDVNDKYVEYLRQNVFYKPFGWKEGDGDDSVAVQKGKCAIQMLGLAMQGKLAEGKCGAFIVGEMNTGKSLMLDVMSDLFENNVRVKQMAQLKKVNTSGTVPYYLYQNVIEGVRVFYTEEGLGLDEEETKALIGGWTSSITFHIPNATSLEEKFSFPSSFFFTMNEKAFLRLFKHLSSDEYKRIVLLRTEVASMSGMGSDNDKHPRTVIAKDVEGYRVAMAHLLQTEADAYTRTSDAANYAIDVVEKLPALMSDRQWWLTEKGLIGGPFKPKDFTDRLIRSLFYVNPGGYVTQTDFQDALLAYTQKTSIKQIGEITMKAVAWANNNRPEGTPVIPGFHSKTVWHQVKLRQANGLQVFVPALKGISLRDVPVPPSVSMGTPATPSASQHAPHTPSAFMASPVSHSSSAGGVSVHEYVKVVNELANVRKENERLQRECSELSERLTQQPTQPADDGASVAGGDMTKSRLDELKRKYDEQLQDLRKRLIKGVATKLKGDVREIKRRRFNDISEVDAAGDALIEQGLIVVDDVWNEQVTDKDSSEESGEA